MDRYLATVVFVGLFAACGAKEASPPAPVAPEISVVVECEEEAATLGAPQVGNATTTLGDDAVTLAPARFDELPGWSADQHADSVPAFLRSCDQLDEMADDAAVGAAPYSGTASDWRAACAAAREVPAGDHAAARQLFETQFRAYSTRGRDGAEGKMTGYNVAQLRGSLTRGGKYLFPLYARPADLVSIQLNEFVPDGRSRRVWGRVDPATGKVVRYGERKQIREKLSDDQVLLWVDDPVDAIHVEIEGSGRATLEDGSEVWVGFAGKNGLRSGRNGTVMRAMRALRKAKGDAPWTERDLNAFYKISDIKLAMVFFELQRRGGAIGTQDVVLTGGRSAAVDRAVIPLSAPLWIDTTAPPAPGQRHAPWQRVVIAQDTGGAILGSVRVDLYFGDDADAGKIASRVNGPGRVWLMLPRAIEL